MAESTLEAQLVELKAALETSLETKNKEQITKDLASFEEKAKGLFATDIKSMKDTLETEFKAQIKVVQDHADKLDARLQAAKSVQDSEAKTFEQVLGKALEDKTDTIEKFNRGEIKKFDMELDLKAVAAFGTGNVTGGTQWAGIQKPGIITNPSTRTHIRELLNVLPAGPGTDFYFMRENGNGEGAPAPAAEGATKSQFDVDLVESSVKFETIAGWMLMSRKAMLNIPGLMAYLNLRLPEKLWDVEDAQILYGNGTSPNLKGILTSGNFVAGQATGSTPLVEKIIKDMSLLEDTYKRSATGILMRPADYYTFFLNKAAGSGEYDLPQGVTFVNGVLYILGVPVAKPTALTAGDYVVGDFERGAELYQQEAMRIEFFEQDSTNVRTNQVTVRIEETVALPVYGGDYFVKGSSLLS